VTLPVPNLATMNVASLVLTVAAVLAVFRFKVGMIPVLAACSAAGVLLYLLTGTTA
jgi:chromate transporter